MDSKDTHSLNIDEAICRILEGKTTFFKEEHLENIAAPVPLIPRCLSPYLNTIPSGITIDLREEQPANAPSPIEVTPLGIIIEVRDEQPANALSPIETQLSGIITDFILSL
jgi:hypothetical protein